MTIRHLRIFVSVFQNESITKAANALHLAQPSVSLAVKELEDYYGIRLFERMSRKIYATETGRFFYDYALHIVSLFDELETNIRDSDSLGILRIGSSITIGNYLLPGLINTFKKSHPHMKVTALINNSNIIEQNILDNRLDLALVEGCSSHPRIKKIPFMSDRLCLICGPGHPLAEQQNVHAKDLPLYDFIMREKGSAGREIFESLMLVQEMDITPVWESVSTRAIVNAVSQGLGLSVLPYLMVKEDLENGRILEKSVGEISLNRDFHIIYHQNKYISQSAQDFIELCCSSQ